MDGAERLTRALRYVAPIMIGLAGLALGLMAAPEPFEALDMEFEPRTSLPLVSLLSPISPVSNANLGRSLAAYGYVPGENIRLQFKFANRREELLDRLASEIVGAGPRVIVAVNPTAAAAAQRATSTIPIVFVGLSNSVGMGLVKSLARPGGNITGITNMPSDLNAKQLEILRDALPGLNSVALVARSGNVNSQLLLEREMTAARSLGLEPAAYNIPGPEAFESTCLAIAEAGIGAALIIPDSTFTTHEPEMMQAALRHRIAVIANSRDFTDAGALISYGTDYGRLFETMFDPVAGYIDRILKGADPADLPVDQPMNVKLIVNLRAARALGISLPRSLLVRANELVG